MVAFATMRRCAVVACLLLSASSLEARAEDDGKSQYEALCARCHGGDGNGGELGPAIAARLATRNDEEVAATVRDGVPRAGMPGFALPAAEVRTLIAFLRTLRPTPEPIPVRGKVETTDGHVLEGVILNQTTSDMQLLTDDKRIHLLRRVGDRYRSVTSQTDWPTYHGFPGGNRYSPLDQIDKSNVARLAPRWSFTLEGAGRLQVTPLVVDGVMYVTNANECYALDAGSGRALWHFKPPRTRGVAGDAAGGINRGVAVAGDRVFMVTDHAHLLALDRATGRLVWDSEMADWHQNYGATSAPLTVGRLVISGTSGGDEGVRGFLAAFDQATGKEVWRFWTVPAAGEPGSETWKGADLTHACATPWFTGTYDAAIADALLADGQPVPRLRRQPPRGRQPLLRLDPGPGCADRHAQVVLPVHASRRVGLGCRAAAGPRRRAVAGEAAEAPASRQPQRLLLRPRPHERRAPPGEAVREEAHLGAGDRTRWPAGAQPRAGPDSRRPHRLPSRRGRDELVLHLLQPADRALLRADAGEVHGLHARARRVEAGAIVLRRCDEPGAGRAGPEDPARDRHPDGSTSRGSCPSRERPSRGAACSRRRADSCSSPRTAER